MAGLTAKGLAASTVQRCYQLLTKVMAAAVDAGMIPQTPCRRVPLPRIERKEMRFRSPSEVWKLADAIAPEYRALILLGPSVGCASTTFGTRRCHPMEVGARAGHASVSFTLDRYSHLYPEADLVPA